MSGDEPEKQREFATNPDELRGKSREEIEALWTDPLRLDGGMVVVPEPDGGEASDPLAALGDTANWLSGTEDTAEKPKLYASRKGHDVYFERHRDRRSASESDAKGPSSAL